MKIALIHGSRFPVTLYGGTERVIWWLAKALNDLGHKVSLVCLPGSTCPFATVIPHDFKASLTSSLFSSFDVLHFFSTPSPFPEKPFVVTIEGNGKLGESFHRNTVFVSKKHAERHQATAFVYNGVDPDEYLYSESKEDYFAFCAKASWRVKNVDGAIRFVSREKQKLKILGGSRWYSWRRNISWLGMVGGHAKAELLAKAKGLLFPIEWQEPFGIAVVEALVSGTPVIASRRGSMQELVSVDEGKKVGFLCETEADFSHAIQKIEEIDPKTCREWALEKFHYRKMAQDYLKSYEEVISGRALNSEAPQALYPPEEIFPISRS